MLWDHSITPCMRPPVSTISTSTILHLPSWQNIAETQQNMAEYCRNTIHTPTCFHHFNLHYIPPVLLVKYNKNLAEYSRTSQEHHIYAHLFPPSQPLLYSTCPIGKIWQKLSRIQQNFAGTPDIRPPVPTISTSTIFHLFCQQNLTKYSRRHAPALLCVLYIIQHLLTQQSHNIIYPFPLISTFFPYITF